ncbi:MAG: pSer/pThr/pTyr-binding forkhead associated (FHA) protein [Bradymonadia bacterium]
MYTCNKCSRENEESYKFCLGCGADLAKQREDAVVAEPEIGADNACPTCGSETQAGQRFCGHCGGTLNAKSPSGAIAPVASGASPAVGNEPPQASGGDTTVGALIKVNPDGSAGDSIPLMDGRQVLGRASDAPLLANDRFLDEQHAAFTHAGGVVKIEDLNSLNGVYYRITEITELQHGEMMRIGQEVLRFELLDLADPVIETPADGTVIGGSSPAGAWGRLERLSGPEEASFAFLLRGSEQVLGRERGDILFRDDGYVSGRHCRVFVDSGRYFIEDLKSSNGTFVRIRGERDVASGALILMGEQPFRVQLS